MATPYVRSIAEFMSLEKNFSYALDISAAIDEAKRILRVNLLDCVVKIASFCKDTEFHDWILVREDGEVTGYEYDYLLISSSKSTEQYSLEYGISCGDDGVYIGLYYKDGNIFPRKIKQMHKGTIGSITAAINAEYGDICLNEYFCEKKVLSFVDLDGDNQYKDIAKCPSRIANNTFDLLMDLRKRIGHYVMEINGESN